MPHYNTNERKKRILTPGDLNWGQHLVSRLGLSSVSIIIILFPLRREVARFWRYTQRMHVALVIERNPLRILS